MPYTISNIYVPPGSKTKVAYRRTIQVQTYPNSTRIRSFSEIVQPNDSEDSEEDSSPEVGSKRPRDETAKIQLCNSCYGSGFVGQSVAIKNTPFHLYTRKECRECGGHGFFNQRDLEDETQEPPPSETQEPPASATEPAEAAHSEVTEPASKVKARGRAIPK